MDKSNESKSMNPNYWEIATRQMTIVDENQQNKFKNAKIAVIGCGGIGMSALERYFNSLGKIVLGYDKTETELTSELIKEGIDIHFEDNVELIPSDINQENTLVIYTPAIPKEHTELNYFFDHNFEVLKRSEVLGAITKHTYAIGVAGAEFILLFLAIL